MHSTSTLAVFDGVTKTLGQLLWLFNDHVCPEYNTCETTKEVNKWTKCKASQAAKKKYQNPAGANLDEGHEATEKVVTVPKKQKFNLVAYNPHSLGHYSSWIQHFGTTDSYSTQTVFFPISSCKFVMSSYYCATNLLMIMTKTYLSQIQQNTITFQSPAKSISTLQND